MAAAQAPRQVCRVYVVQDLLTTPDGRVANDAGKRLGELASEIKRECFAGEGELDFSISPFASNLSLVVSATPNRQADVAVYLKLKRTP